MLYHMGLNENQKNCLLNKLCSFLRRNLKQSICYYPDSFGLELKKLLAKKYVLSPENIFISNGSDEALFLIVSTFKQITHIICPEHTFMSYQYCAKFFQKKVTQIPLNHYTISVEETIKKITKNSLIIIPNPHNPCGTYLNDEQINILIKTCQKKKAYLLVDEAYGEFAEKEQYDYKSAIKKPYSKLIVLRTFSKFYGLAGLRCGYVVASKKIIKEINVVKNILVYNVNNFALLSAQFLLENETEAKNRKNFQYIYVLKKKLYNFCDRYHLEYIKSSTNFVLINVKNADDIYYKLLNKKIQTKSCSVFGYPQFLRVTLSSKKDLKIFQREIHKLVVQS